MIVLQIESLCQYDGEEQNGSIKLSDGVKGHFKLFCIGDYILGFVGHLQWYSVQSQHKWLCFSFLTFISTFLSQLTVDDDDWNPTGNCGEFWGVFRLQTELFTVANSPLLTSDAAWWEMFSVLICTIWAFRLTNPRNKAWSANAT